MSGATAAMLSGSVRRLDRFTITIGGADPYGYSNGVFGSIGDGVDDIYVDKGGNNRQIMGAVDGPSSSLILSINGASVPNSDATFAFIEVGSTRYYRTAATYNGSASGGTQSSWTWGNGATNSIGTSGSQTLDIWA